MSGRRGARIEDDDRWVFNRLADAYAWRPAYPEALVAALAALAPRLTLGVNGGSEARRVVDLGAGTGHLAIPLAASGMAVIAVEPARRMLDALRARAHEAGVQVTAVHASAEHTGLPAHAFDLALVVDALHWVDPELAGKEIGRLLAPGGAAAVVEVELGATAFLDELFSRVESVNPKARRAVGGEAVARQLLACAAPAVEPQLRALEDELDLSPEAAGGVVRSLSFVGPALSQEAVDELRQWAERFARERGARWRRRYVVRWVQASSRA